MTAVSDETGRDAFVAALASLAAAISLLERTPRSKKAAASDKMFDQMIVDYKKALEEGRAALSASPVGEPALRLCGYCKTWNSKPCGEQCYLSPSDPVWTSPPATPAGVGADKLRELASCLDRALGDTDPSISSDYTDDEIKRDYPVFWVCQQLNAILALLSRAGDQK